MTDTLLISEANDGHRQPVSQPQLRRVIQALPWTAPESLR